MMDTRSYVTFLVANLSQDTYVSAIESLESVAELIRQKGTIFKHVSQPQFTHLFDQASSMSEPVKQLLIAMHDQNDLGLLPRVVKAFRRELERNGHAVIDLTLPGPHTSADPILEHFGPHAIVLRHNDPSLLAGAVIETSQGTYELSARGLLAQIEATLKKPMKGSYA